MPIIFVPRNGGYWKNGTLHGDGDMIDTLHNMIKSGTFLNGNLNGDNCLYINKSGASLVNTRLGTFSNGKENGQIYEYVFGLDKWEDFLNSENGTLATKYTHIFNNGKWVSTSATETNVKIKGTILYTDEKVSGFKFEELLV